MDVTAAPLAVAVSPAEVWTRAGQTVSVTVDIGRGPGGDGDVTVSIESDAGLMGAPLTIGADAGAGTLTVPIPSGFAQGDVALTVDARLPAALAQATLLVHVGGASGTLDTSFGTGGVSDLTPSSGSDVGAAMLVLQNDIIVGGTHTETSDAGAVSTIKVLMLTSGGAVDTTDFAVTTAPPSVMSELHALARLPDGSLYAIGDVRTPKADFAAVHIRSAGGLDPTYAVATSLTSLDDIAFAGVVQPIGQLTVAGTAGGSAFAVARYTQTPPVVDAGTDSGEAGASDATVEASPVTSVLDPTFADGGIALTTFAQPNAGATALLVAPDGSLLVVGSARGSSSDIVALRYSPNGTVDATYGDGGAAAVQGAFATTSVGAALLDPAGNVVLVTSDAQLMRLLPTGAPDATFGTVSLFSGGPASAFALARDPATGSLYVGGATTSNAGCFIARVTAAGKIDPAFAVLTTTACSVVALGVDDAGKLVALETVGSGTSHMVVARYWP